MNRQAKRAKRARLKAYRKLGKATIAVAESNAALRQAQQVFNNAKLAEAITWEASENRKQRKQR